MRRGALDALPGSSKRADAADTGALPCGRRRASRGGRNSAERRASSSGVGWCAGVQGEFHSRAFYSAKCSLGYVPSVPSSLPWARAIACLQFVTHRSDAWQALGKLVLHARHCVCGALRVRVRNTTWRNFGTPFAWTLEGQAWDARILSGHS